MTLALARAGFHVTAIDSSAEMLDTLLDRLAGEPAEVRRRVEPVQQDMRRLGLDRLYRFVCLPFNTLLMLTEPRDRQSALDGIREHLAPSGAFAFDVFTPDPRLLRDSDDWELELEHDVEDPTAGVVHLRRDVRRQVDFSRQVTRVQFRCHVSAAGEELADWEDDLEIAYVFPRELELMLERQGLRVEAREGGPSGERYQPSEGDVQPQYVTARLIA